MRNFILAENPYPFQENGLWLVHLSDPVCIIEAVSEGDQAFSAVAGARKSFVVEDVLGVVERWELRIHHYFTTEFDERLNSKELCDQMLQDAWLWFSEYLSWEDHIDSNLN